MSDTEEDVEEVLTNKEVLNKYLFAANVVNAAIAKVVAELKPGSTVLELCVIGDRTIEEEVKKVLKSQKDIEKGIAFPTCISRNHVVGHNSAEIDDKEKLEDGDLVKIDLGAHIDGFIVVAAHTHIVGQATQPTTGKKGDTICAAHVAAEAVLRLLRPGVMNKDITAVIKQVAEAYHVNPVEGVLSHQMRRFVIDGPKVIINKQTAEQTPEEFEIEENDVFGIDIVMSSGEGKPKEGEKKTTVYKRDVDQSYSLKLNAARKVFGEIRKNFPALPFSVRAIQEKHARFGLKEIEQHGLILPFPVLLEKNGEFVAQFKFTALVGPNGAKRITEHALPYVSSDFSVEDSKLKELLATTPVFGEEKKKEKKKPEAGEGSSTTTATTTTTEATPMDTA